MTITLYSDAKWVSPYAMSAFVALVEKRVPFDVSLVDLDAKAHFQPGYPARTRRVPCLVDDDFVLAESSAIAEYLEEKFPAPAHPALFPPDLRSRAIAREVMAWIRSDLLPIREERPTTTVFGPPSKTKLSERAEAARVRLVDGASQLVRDGQTTLFREWCLADVDLSLMLQRLHLSGDPLPPALARYAEANWKRPSVVQWLAHRLPTP
ncbi:MAG: glutathione transferase [Myxococcaceae bacterium]|jgi:glutathione S-transferase|nr:glutathione transferase [Myxococcaceae bacterium]